MSIAFFFLAGLALAAQTTEPSVQSNLDAVAAAASGCKQPGIFFTQFTNEPRLIRVLVPKEVWSIRTDALVAAKLDCIAGVVIQRGYKPIFLGLRH